jgi:hypothetical protein
MNLVSLDNESAGRLILVVRSLFTSTLEKLDGARRLRNRQILASR